MEGEWEGDDGGYLVSGVALEGAEAVEEAEDMRGIRGVGWVEGWREERGDDDAVNYLFRTAGDRFGETLQNGVEGRTSRVGCRWSGNVVYWWGRRQSETLGKVECMAEQSRTGGAG